MDLLKRLVYVGVLLTLVLVVIFISIIAGSELKSDAIGWAAFVMGCYGSHIGAKAIAWGISSVSE